MAEIITKAFNKLSGKKCLTGLASKFAVVCGAQWGDEGIFV